MKKFIITMLSVGTMSLACNGADIPPPKSKIASWYGKPFHGRLTASGYVYDMEQMTCASLDYPFGSVLKVTNLDNGKNVNVIVTDTGDFKKKYGRDIDLSKKAFSKLDKIGKGLLNVKIELIDSSKSFRYKHGKPVLNEKIYWLTN
ncbi:MAG: septal ring lytic transglycosylase RlpA family protein [Cellulosilyticaceae bacterium]